MLYQLGGRDWDLRSSLCLECLSFYLKNHSILVNGEKEKVALSLQSDFNLLLCQAYCCSILRNSSHLGNYQLLIEKVFLLYILIMKVVIFLYSKFNAEIIYKNLLKEVVIFFYYKTRCNSLLTASFLIILKLSCGRMLYSKQTALKSAVSQEFFKKIFLNNHPQFTVQKYLRAEY